MALTPGARLGPYEVIASIGAGGMGEVYRALDTNLKRSVAIKVLPESVASDRERLARFQREAELLASLNHPNIAAIYGLERSGGMTALVLELVEGPTLGDRIALGSIPLDEALSIAKQIAEALEAAHEQGIIHRDLKPANVKVREDGTVKVLDFGLAKVLEPAVVTPDIATSPTIASPAMTQIGMILGTAAYMSPEQAKGRPADKRADIWAFGVVLYEMLSGHRPFDGDDIVDVLGAVARLEPKWDSLPIDVPPPIHTLLQSCLMKDRRQRVGDMSVARFVLEKGASLGPGDAGPTPRPPAPPSLRRWALPLAAALAVGAFFAGSGSWFVARPGQNSETVAYLSAYDLPEGLQIPPPPRPSAAGRFALSPDGRRLAFVATDGRNRVQLWVRVLEALTAEPLVGTEGASFPFWSPDSRSIAFVAQNTLKKVDVLGGPPVTLSTSAAEGRGSWNESGVILFSTDRSSFAQVSTLREASSPATPLDLGQGQRVGWPSFLPDGQHFLYSVGRASARTTEVYVGSLDPQEKGTLLLAEASGAMYAQDHVIFQRGTTLMAQAFDVERRTLAGAAVPIVESLDVAGGLGNPGAFSVSTTGVLAYQTDGGDGGSQLVWRDRSGGRLSALGDAVDQINVALSPDGARVAVSVLDSARNTRDLWLYDVARGHRTQFTSNVTDELLPVWSPDGGRLAYGSNERGPLDIYLRNLTGVGESEVLLEGPGNKYTTSWSRNGFLTYFNGISGSARTLQDVWTVPVLGVHTATAFIQSEAPETYGQFSPDGRWLAYSSGESRHREIYVMPFPGPGPKVQVSTAGGDYPRWHSDGRELFFLSNDNDLVAVEVDGRAGFIVGAARTLFGTHARTVSGRGVPSGYPYDVSRDGQRFLVNESVAQIGKVPIMLLINWTAGLKK